MYQIKVSEDGLRHSIFLFNDLGESNEYYDLVSHFAELSTKHTVYLYIDSTGGDFHTSIVISNAIKLCRAKVNAIIMCRCYSGATAIVLACDAVSVQQRASFMIHNCRVWRKISGVYINEIEDWISTEIHIWHRFFQEVYVESGFLDDDEAHDILYNGKELYITTSDLIERLAKINLLCTSPLDCDIIDS